MDRDPLRVPSATGVDVALPIAGAGSRSYAFLIDWHIRILLAGAWFLVAGALAQLRLFTLPDATSPTGLLVVLPPLLIYFLYHPVLEVAMRGLTPGKRMAGVRLVTRDGGTPSAGALLIRNVFRLIDSLPMFYMLGLGVVFVTRERVRIGDLAAGIVLVTGNETALGVLEAFAAGATTSSAQDPALVEIAQDLLQRWPDLDRTRRHALARTLLQRLGAPESVGADDALLRDRLRAALHGVGPR